ncbi:uncharacterized protein LOC132572011 [Heteronotia binoei]|uniref:uncharacterized protein LOC132572011 n=1 Tax=Heteronotia binoei TaxID=13085 RepID=UPI00292E76CA|nr:uncharacterized protein LOC132572011 [Heteronotia binoei]
MSCQAEPCQLLMMEEGQIIASAIKNPNKEETRRKKKRLTFLDEVHATRPDEQARLKELRKLFATKGTNFLTFGLNLVKRSYQQALDIAGVTFNSRKGKLVLADGRGLSTLDLFSSNSAAKREMIFPRYQFNLVRIVTYSEKYNVYFILARDYTIKVYNKNYNEICSVENRDSRRLTFISFNPVTDEVISGGTKGVQLWKFKEKKVQDYSNVIHMMNYSLFLSAEYPYMGRKWCTSMEFDVNMQRFYCFSDCHFFCYDIRGNLLFEIPNAHQTAVVSCVYSSHANILLTACRGIEIKSWNDQACLVHVFQGHTKAVTKLLLHPTNTSLFISGSLDGSIKLWSFDSMQLFYSLSIFQEGILWIGTLHDSLLYCSSVRSLHLYDLNSFTSFWAHINGRISNLRVCTAGGKSSRVIAVGVDNSLSSPLCYSTDEGPVYADNQEFLVLGMQEQSGETGTGAEWTWKLRHTSQQAQETQNPDLSGDDTKTNLLQWLKKEILKELGQDLLQQLSSSASSALRKRQERRKRDRDPSPSDLFERQPKRRLSLGLDLPLLSSAEESECSDQPSDREKGELSEEESNPSFFPRILF